MFMNSTNIASWNDTLNLLYTLLGCVFIFKIMKLTSRFANAFIEIKVDEIETTVFKSDKNEVLDMIYNLLDIVNDLASYTGKSVAEHVEDGGF